MAGTLLLISEREAPGTTSLGNLRDTSVNALHNLGIGRGSG